MPNAIAYLALFSWPIVMLVLLIRLPFDKALIWSLLGAYLLLPPEPASIEFPLVRSLNKETLTVILFSGLALWRHGTNAFALPRYWLTKVLMAVFVISPLFTVLNNGEPLVFVEGLVIPGLKWNDALGLCIKKGLTLMPFIMAYNALNNRQSLRSLLNALVISGLFYSLLMLIEIRLSPQLNMWIYGYHQHLFSQSVRASGFRPLVFLDHGLWLAFFAMTACLSSLALWRATPPPARTLYMIGFLYLFAILVLSKSLGALLFAIIMIPMIMIIGRNTQLTITMIVAAFVLTYPMLKTTGLFPGDALVAQAAKISPERAHSQKFRFDNEDELLERASEKPIFGWGSWGRNQIRDPMSGELTSVTDGRWIITFGVYGWVGFIAEFALLILPLLRLRRAVLRETAEKTSATIGALSLILAFNVLDLVPNATLTPLTWVIAGVLLGYGDRALIEFDPVTRGRKEPIWKPIL